jgi:hypothetical protein
MYDRGQNLCLCVRRQAHQFGIPLVMTDDDGRRNPVRIEERNVISRCGPILVWNACDHNRIASQANEDTHSDSTEQQRQASAGAALYGASEVEVEK